MDILIIIVSIIITIILSEILFWKIPIRYFNSNSLYEKEVLSLIYSGMSVIIFWIIYYIGLRPLMNSWTNITTGWALLIIGAAIELIALIMLNVKLMKRYEKKRR